MGNSEGHKNLTKEKVETYQESNIREKKKRKRIKVKNIQLVFSTDKFQ